MTTVKFSSAAEQAIDKVIMTAFSDVLGEVDKILIQIEEQWGDRKFFIDLQGKVIPDRSI